MPPTSQEPPDRPLRTIHGHTREALSSLAAVHRGSGADADDELRAALPLPEATDIVEMIRGARLDPRYVAIAEAIERDPARLERVRARAREFEDQLGQYIATPFAEFDGESGYLVAAALDAAAEMIVLLAVVADHEGDGQSRLTDLTAPVAERAARDRFLASVSEEHAATLSGPARAVRDYLAARRAGTEAQRNDAAAELRHALTRLRWRDGRDAETWADAAFDVILESIEEADGRFRAEINAAKAIAYLETAVHPAADDYRLRRDEDTLDVERHVSIDSPLGTDKEGPTVGDLLGTEFLEASLESRLDLDDLIRAASLTRREAQVYALTALGKKQREIAPLLGIRMGTVGVHAMHAKDKIRRARQAA